MKNIKIFILIFLVSSFLINCQEKGTRPFISLNITDQAKFENDTIAIEDFIFSPITSNAIWTFHTSGPSYELSLTDGSWTKLDKKFGHYSSGLQRDNINIDPKDKNLVWISNFHEGLIVYNIKKDTFFEFKELKPVSSICFLESNVIIGTWSGLYTIDRKKNKVVKSENIAEINVFKIEKIDEHRLLINNKYEYNHKFDKVLLVREPDNNIYSQKELNGFSITTYNDGTLAVSKGNIRKEFKYDRFLIDNVTIDKENIWIPFQNLENGIIKFNYYKNLVDTIQIGLDFSSYKLKDEPENIWFYNDLFILCFNKKNGSTKQIQLEKSINNLVVDLKYLYCNTWHSFEVYKKNYLLQNSVDIKVSITEENKFKELRDSLEILRSIDFKGYYNSIKILSSRFRRSTNKRILQQLEMIQASLSYGLPDDFEQIKAMEEYVRDSISENQLKASYYLHAVMAANYCGKLKESLKYDSILRKNYPANRSEYHDMQMTEVAKSYKIIQSINSSKEPADVKLWRLGKTYYELFFHVGPTNESSSYNMTFPFIYLKSLLKRYPNSIYADDAEFLMLKHDEESSHEGGDNSYNLEAIEEYKKILKKYPKSELIPEIYYIVYRLYNECESSFEDKPKYYKLALYYVDKILTEYPKFAKENNVLEDKISIKRSISEFLWQLHISSSKNEYTIDEPIVITFNLKNIDTKPKAIKILKENQIPNFSIDIEMYLNDDPYNYTNIKLERATKSYRKVLVDTLIGANQTYRETWDIEHRARDSFREAPGKFILNKPGRYKIYAQASENYHDHSIPSNIIWIDLKDKKK
ncbi:MAG: hypothetical protein IPQ18_02265 [Saprospiraceae bacterium]|nr:hypothetical protein [Saprospiraceae bacterium]